MGVADNKTYKDQYHFHDNTWTTGKIKVKIEGTPSLNTEPEINSTLKENPYRANVEVEKNEIIYKPDLSALFKANGKKHSQGGIDVYLEPGSFVFSDDKDLAFSEEDHKLMELKEGGNFKTKNNTPAEVLKRNVDLEHYNRLTNNLSDPYKDDLAKKSSARMLEKYINILGRVGYMQEAKKQFPTGLPPFSEDTAPIYDSGLKSEIMEQKQYAKYGGSIGNPYLEQLQWGGMAAAMSRGMQGQRTAANSAGSAGAAGNEPKEGEIKVMNGQQYIYQGGQWLLMSGVPADENIPVEEELETAIVGNIPLKRSRQLISPTGLKPRSTPEAVVKNLTNTSSVPQVTNVQGQGQGAKEVNWNFTPWQKISQLNSLYNAVSAKRYMPYRSRYNAAYAEPSLLNPEQAVGDARAMASQQTQSLNTLNPILRNAQASSVYGQLLDQVPGIRSQYDNQNAQIQNQFRQYNNQVKNQESQVNMQNDARYYQESIIGQQNFDNMKTYLKDQYLNNLLRDVETNQSLAYNLLTQENPAYDFDWKTGNFKRLPKNVLDAQTDSKSDFYTQLAHSLMTKINSGQTPTKQEVDFFKALSIGKIPFNPAVRKKRWYG